MRPADSSQCVCLCVLSGHINPHEDVSHINKHNRKSRPSRWITINSVEPYECNVSNIVHIVWGCGTHYVIVEVFWMCVHFMFYRKKCCKGFKFVLGQCIPEGRENMFGCLSCVLVIILEFPPIMSHKLFSPSTDFTSLSLVYTSLSVSNM